MRDGNQALIDPMDAEKKTASSTCSSRCGLKEIEVGFPSAGATEFDFISGLVTRGPHPRRRHAAGADPVARRPDPDQLRQPGRREDRDRPRL
jgi:isopropylmalate/homocitrate/citramalate synthase